MLKKEIRPGSPFIRIRAGPGRRQRYDCAMVCLATRVPRRNLGVKLEEEKSTNVTVYLFHRNTLRANFKGICVLLMSNTDFSPSKSSAASFCIPEFRGKARDVIRIERGTVVALSPTLLERVWCL